MKKGNLVLQILIFGISFCIIGCGTTASSPSNVPAWDSDMPLDNRNTEAPSVLGRVGKVFSEGKSDYHFRKARWGFSRERVELSEIGTIVFKRTPDTLIYKCKLNGVYCYLVYTFKNNRLRTAGYLSISPIPNADSLVKDAVEKYGMPDSDVEHLVGNELKEKLWKMPDTVIFSNLYVAARKMTQTKYNYSGEGLLKHLVRDELPEKDSGEIKYWAGTYAHVDPAFFAELQEIEFPLAELSHYEKLLTGVLVKNRGTRIPGLGTIPSLDIK